MFAILNVVTAMLLWKRTLHEKYIDANVVPAKSFQQNMMIINIDVADENRRKESELNTPIHKSIVVLSLYEKYFIEVVYVPFDANSATPAKMKSVNMLSVFYVLHIKVHNVIHKTCE